MNSGKSIGVTGGKNSPKKENKPEEKQQQLHVSVCVHEEEREDFSNLGTSGNLYQKA